MYRYTQLKKERCYLEEFTASEREGFSANFSHNEISHPALGVVSDERVCLASL